MAQIKKELELGRCINDSIEEREMWHKKEGYEAKRKLFRITHYAKEVLICVKCNNSDTILEPCNNCGSMNDFTAYGDCIKCNQKHQQSVWVCEKCNCKNPLEKTLHHSVQIEGPLNNGFWDKVFEYI